MNTNSTRRFARYVGLPVAAIGVVGAAAIGFTGIANAETLPTTGPTVAMTITNDSNLPIFLQGSSNPYGQWIAGPRSMLSPHASEIVTTSTNNPWGIGVDVTYALPGGGQAVFSANNYPGETGVDGTRITGNMGDWGINRTAVTGFPAMNATYNLFGHP